MGCNADYRQGGTGEKVLKGTVYNTKDHNIQWRCYGYLWTLSQNNYLYRVKTKMMRKN